MADTKHTSFYIRKLKEIPSLDEFEGQYLIASLDETTNRYLCFAQYQPSVTIDQVKEDFGDCEITTIEMANGRHIAIKEGFQRRPHVQEYGHFVFTQKQLKRNYQHENLKLTRNGMISTVKPSIYKAHKLYIEEIQKLQKEITDLINKLQ